MRKTLALLVLLGGCAAAPVAEPPREEQMAAVRAGMAPAQVEELLGRPSGGTATYGSGETVSGWGLPRQGVMLISYFNVHYRDGKVARTSRSFEPTCHP